MRVLIAGARGQLGRALPATLRDHDTTALDRAALDIADLAAVRQSVLAHRPDLVLNAAAYNHVDGAESDPEAAFRGNAVGPRNLALAAAEAGAAVLHVSTDYVFDGTAGRAYHEYDQPNPLSVYGRSKLAGEEAVRAANPRHYVVRTAWLYAAEGHNFPLTMLSLGAKGAVRVVNDQHGSPTFAPHLADAIARLLTTGAWGTYHLAGAGETTWHELTRTLFEMCGVASPVEAVTTDAFPRPASRPRYSALTSIQEPRIVLPPWQEGLAEFARARRGP
jgi:dTDP-4-dehydrorhamnose reductase